MSLKMKLAYISWIPAALVMCVIFLYSSKTGNESSQTSSSITNTILKTLDHIGLERYTDQKLKKVAETLEHVIRKIAHGLEYMILSLCIVFHLSVCGFDKKNIVLYAIIISAAYAATDEFHQLFVEGRSGQIKDVLIDTIGASIGAGCYFLWKSGMKKK